MLGSTFKKLRPWHLVPLLHGKEKGENPKTLFYPVTNFIFLGSNITADGDCSHE